MNKKVKGDCPLPRVNKLLILLFLVFIGEAVYIGYLKVEIDKEYVLMSELKILNIIYQKIEAVFDKKNSHRSFDEIVRNTQHFGAILEQVNVRVNQFDLAGNERLYSLYDKLQKDYQLSREYIERFKSWNSLAVNSTRLIFDMHESIQRLIYNSQNVDNKYEFIRLLDALVKKVALLEYDGLSDIESIKITMKQFDKMSQADEELTKEAKRLYKHMGTLFEGYAVMQELRAENRRLNINKSLDEMHRFLLDGFKRQDKENYKNILVSNVLIIALFIILFFTDKKGSVLNYKLCKINIELESHVEELELVNKGMAELMDKLDKNIISSKTDAKGKITYASEAFCKISGYTREELIGKPHSIVRHPDMPKSLYKELWETIKCGKEWHGEIKNKNKNKGFYWVDVNILPEFDDQGRVSGYSAIRHEVTAKKELEELSLSLEEQVKQRTHELEKMVSRVEKLSITDELTQLYNRRHYSQVLDAEIRRAKRSDCFINYVLIDIDNFKKYNDTYGHQQGDEALKKVAGVLSALCKRPEDFVFRMGGEEFAVVFSSEEKQQAIKFTKKISKAITDLEIEHLGNPPFNILTVSAGLVSCRPRVEGDDESMIYKKADKLLYEAKKAGRNIIKY